MVMLIKEEIQEVSEYNNIDNIVFRIYSQWYWLSILLVEEGLY